MVRGLSTFDPSSGLPTTLDPSLHPKKGPTPKPRMSGCIMPAESQLRVTNRAIVRKSQSSIRAADGE
jgi:hypothetical protein